MHCFYFILFYFHSFGVPFLLSKRMILALLYSFAGLQFRWITVSLG